MAGLGLHLSAIRAVSVSGQQHGTVYWAKGAGERLRAMAADAGAAEGEQSARRPAAAGASKDGSGGGGGRGGAAVAKATPAVAVAVLPTAVPTVETSDAAVPAGDLAEAFAGCFAVEDSPIWADGSTEEYARELEKKMGGSARLAELTGSRAHLRQGAPQIMKVIVCIRCG